MRTSYKSFADVEAKCPFYQGLTCGGSMLRCEGLVENTVTNIKFRTPQSCARHMASCCNTFGYAKCPIYRALWAKYA